MGRIKTLFAMGGAQFKPVTITIDGEETLVYVGKISVAQRDRFLKLIQDASGPGAGQAYAVQVGAFEDDQGTRSFSDSDEDTAAIMAAPVQFVHALAQEVLVFNRLAGPEDPVKDAAKN